MKEILDTIYIVKIDTATNTEIYYHETVKLIENSGWLSTTGAFLIALLALVVSLVFSYLGYRQNKKNLEYSRLNNEATREYEKLKNAPSLSYLMNRKKHLLLVKNNGYGIAFNFKVYYKYNDFEDKSIKNLLRKIIPSKSLNTLINLKSSKSTIFKGSDLNIGDSANLFELNVSKVKQFRSILDQVKIIITYKDVFGEEYKKTKHYDWNQS